MHFLSKWTLELALLQSIVTHPLAYRLSFFLRVVELYIRSIHQDRCICNSGQRILLECTSRSLDSGLKLGYTINKGIIIDLFDE